MNKPVDNHREIRIAARFLRIPAWIAEEPEMAARRPLRDARVCSRNALPLETGTAWVRLRERGRSRETGLSHGYLARRAARGVGKARQLTSRCGKAGQGPSISYMEGPCLILPGTPYRQLAQHVGDCWNASRDDPGSRPATGEILKRLRRDGR